MAEDGVPLAVGEEEEEEGDIIESPWLRVHEPCLTWLERGDQLSTTNALLVKEGERLWERSVAVCSAPLTAGVHAGEFAMNRLVSDASWGVARLEDVASADSLREQPHTWLLGANNGALFSVAGGKRNASPAGQIHDGDFLGWLLDLDAGTLRFFRNGQPHGPGHTDVAPPVRVCVELTRKGGAMCLCTGASFAVPPGTRMLFAAPSGRCRRLLLQRPPLSWPSPPIALRRGDRHIAALRESTAGLQALAVGAATCALCRVTADAGCARAMLSGTAAAAAAAVAAAAVAGTAAAGAEEGHAAAAAADDGGFGWYYAGANIDVAGPVIRKRTGFGIGECVRSLLATY